MHPFSLSSFIFLFRSHLSCTHFSYDFFFFQPSFLSSDKSLKNINSFLVNFLFLSLHKKTFIILYLLLSFLFLFCFLPFSITALLFLLPAFHIHFPPFILFHSSTSSSIFPEFSSFSSTFSDIFCYIYSLFLLTVFLVFAFDIPVCFLSSSKLSFHNSFNFRIFTFFFFSSYSFFFHSSLHLLSFFLSLFLHSFYSYFLQCNFSPTTVTYILHLSFIIIIFSSLLSPHLFHSFL